MKHAGIFPLLFLLSHGLFGQMSLLDESYLDPEFLRFKTELTLAILDKDPDRLAPLLHDNLFYSKEIDAAASKQTLLEDLRSPNHPDWKELYRLISFGFTRVKGANPTEITSRHPHYFTAPSFVYTPENSNKLLVTGTTVNIRSRPGTAAPVIATATWEWLEFHHPVTDDLVEENLFVDGKSWYEVVLSNGRIGYIVEDFVSASLLTELTVIKMERGWKIISFFHAPGC